jgi:hypothetical protein
MSAGASNLGHRRRAFAPRLSPSAAILVLGLTGGTDDDWVRLQRRFGLFGLGGRVVLFAVKLAVPLILQALVRKWASNAVTAHRLARR